MCCSLVPAVRGSQADRDTAKFTGVVASCQLIRQAYPEARPPELRTCCFFPASRVNNTINPRKSSRTHVHWTHLYGGAVTMN